MPCLPRTMTVPFLTWLCFLPSILTAALDQGSSQYLSLPSLDTAPVQRLNTSFGNRVMGCFKPKPWVTTNKADCEATLDLFVAGQSLSVPRIFSQNPPEHMNRVVLPYQAWHGTCMLHINVPNKSEEEVMTLADIYAEVMGPDGLAKNCLGQRGEPAIGGRMVLGRKQEVTVTISGRKIQTS